ncbi:ABC transporter substrate-binding protein [Diaminobutyricimonas sp. TR449]|uniref:ABC transporter substrate-binding protein n=1 Tax=Diaminobutyricimonas sp. TR449 TaxID=2708076 RepID=UPI001421A076|nr:ABC transporter substrate-binding protein [Diaminobutyricimonas sp. TR449]
MKVRNRVALGATALTLAATLTGCAGGSLPVVAQEEGALTTVRLVSTLSFNNALSALVVNGEFPQEYGVDFVSVDIADAGSSNQVAALLSGEADAATLGLNTAVDAIAGGAELEIIGGNAVYQGGIVASNDAIEQYGVDTTKKPLAQLAQLKGATIAAGPVGSAGNSTLRAILVSAGLDPDKDVNLVPLADTAGSVAAGLENGTYDATFAPLGSGEVAVERGTATVIVSVPNGDAPVLDNVLPTVTVATKRLLAEQPEIAKAIRDSFRAATELIHTDPDAAGAIIKSSIYEDMDPALFEASWKMAQPGYPLGGSFTEANWDAFVRVYDQFSENDYTVLKFADVVNAVATS